MSRWTKRRNGKAVALALFAAAAVSAAGTAFAANQADFVEGYVDENGQVQYSADGGQTWSSEVPEGVTSTDENGILSFAAGNGDMADLPDSSPELTDVQSIAVKEEDGKTLYSTDDGKTWSESDPGEFVQSVQER